MVSALNCKAPGIVGIVHLSGLFVLGNLCVTSAKDVWGRSDMEAFLLEYHTMGTWPDPAVPDLLQNVHQVLTLFYSNVQAMGLPPGEARIYAFTGGRTNLKSESRYGRPICVAGGEVRSFQAHVRRMIFRFKRKLLHAFAIADASLNLNVSDSAPGRRLVAQAKQKLYQAPWKVLGASALEFEGAPCEKLRVSAASLSSALHKALLEGFFHLYTGLSCSSWAAKKVAAIDVEYHDCSALKLPGYHRGYVLEHLLQALGGSTSPNSPSCNFSWTDGKDALKTRDSLALSAVEIGVWRGTTSERLLRSFPCLRLLSVDIKPRPLVRPLLKQFGWRSVLWQMTSAKAASRYGGTLDFAFIDADHSYEACKEDLELWAPKVRAGGIVAGHDYGAIWPGVVEAVHEYVANNGLKLHLGTDSLWWFQKPT